MVQQQRMWGSNPARLVVVAQFRMGIIILKVSHNKMPSLSEEVVWGISGL